MTFLMLVRFLRGERSSDLDKLMERIQQFGSIAQRTRYLKTLECLEVRKIQVQRCIEGIDESTARRKLESDAARTARLRVYMTKQGLRETRFRLTGEQKKDAAEASGSPTYALFKFLYDRCKSSGFEGCAIPIGHMAAILGKSTRSVQRNLDTLDAAGLIVRIQRSHSARVGSLP